MKIKLITTSNHELALREIAYLLDEKAEVELYNLNQQKNVYDKNTLNNILEKLTENPANLYLFTIRELDRLRTFQISDKLREKGLKAVVGGTYALSNLKECLKHFDTVVIGDAKNSLEKLLKEKKGIIFAGVAEPGLESYDVPLFYLEKNKIIKSESGVKPFRHPQYENKKELSFTTMRGCSQACSYCEVSQLKRCFPDYRLRKKPIEKVLNYTKAKVKKIKPDYVYIWDEDFLLHSDKEIDAFCSLYKEINVPFFIFATPKTVLHGKNKLERLAEVGLNQVNMGIQSGSERIQKELFGRKESIEEGKDATKILVELYKKHFATMQPPMIDFITLNPYENKQDIVASIKYAQNLPKPFNLIAHIMSFFEGTPLELDAIKKGLIDKNYNFDYDLHDFVNNAKEALNGKRRNSKENIYLSSILFRMRGVNENNKCGMINCNEISYLLSEDVKNSYCKNIQNLIKEMDKKYNPMRNNLVYGGGVK